MWTALNRPGPQDWHFFRLAYAARELVASLIFAMGLAQTRSKLSAYERVRHTDFRNTRSRPFEEKGAPLIQAVNKFATDRRLMHIGAFANLGRTDGIESRAIWPPVTNERLQFLRKPKMLG